MNNKTRKKTILILITIIVIIIIYLILNISKTTLATSQPNYNDYKLENVSISITKNDKNNIIEENTIIEKYNTLLVPMDTIFKEMFEDNYKVDTNQTLIYNDTILKINIDENIIKVPTIYDEEGIYETYNNNVIIRTGEYITDYSVDIEIELIDNIRYIPLYLISNIEGVEINIDGMSIYEDSSETSTNTSVATSKFIDIIKSIDKNKEQHNLSIIMTEIDEEESILTSTTYTYETQDGALWREEAYKRIEKYRKKDLKITVKSKNGKIIDDATINLKQESNDFKFGTMIDTEANTLKNNYTNPLGEEQSISASSELTTNLFNIILSGNYFKWNAPTWGDEIRNDIIKYAENHKMSLRGHVLWWDQELGFGDTSYLVGDMEKAKQNETETKEENAAENDFQINGKTVYSMAYIFTQYVKGEFSAKEAEEEAQKLQEAIEYKVLEHIDNYLRTYPEITEWDLYNEPDKIYWLYNLYTRNPNDVITLEDGTKLEMRQFLRTNYDSALNFEPYWTKEINWWWGILADYPLNSDYINFLTRCFEQARKTREELYNEGIAKTKDIKLVFNDNSMGIGHNDLKSHAFYYENKKNVINAITEQAKIIYGDNYTAIDALGFQYHVPIYNETGNWVSAYHHTPQWYYNQINWLLEKTNIKEAVITEYDNIYENSNATDRANYLKDTLIISYSNPKVSEFVFWGYNRTGETGFIKEEWEMYEQLAKYWLNDNQTLNSNESDYYTTRVNNGKYILTVTAGDQIITQEINIAEKNEIEIIIENDYLIYDKLEIEDNIIKNVKFNYQYKDFLKNISTSGIISIHDDNTVLSNNELVKTGDKLKIELSEKNYEYIISVKGDIDGTGLITEEDVNKAYEILRDKIIPKKEEKLSTDVVNDGKLKINDIAKLYQYTNSKISSIT